MAGATIDHLIALTVFLAALLLFIGFFNQMNQTAVLYQYHRYIATKCSDTLDSILLNPGTPSDWGVSGNSTRNLTFFGLQDPEFQEYRMSSFSVMRLVTMTNQVYYSQTGQWYNNMSWGLNGAYLLLQTNDCLNYSNAVSMLGLNGTYDFQLSLTPTLTVNVTQVPDAHLKLKIQAYGSGFPLSNSYLNYLMFWANSSSGGFPVLNSNLTSETIQTDSSGIAYKDFPTLSSNTAFTFIAKIHAAGLSGVGYLSQATVTSSGNIIPYIQSFDNGTASIVLAQKYGQNDPLPSMGDLYYNASFYALPNTFVPILGGSFAGKVNSGNLFQNLNVNTNNQTGFLVVAYGDGTNYGTVIAPLGVNSIGAQVTFGSNVSAKEWVATDLRQIIIGDIGYQAKLSLWSLTGYQVSG
jgi:hypothetical protein